MTGTEPFVDPDDNDNENNNNHDNDDDETTGRRGRPRLRFPRRPSR